MNRLHFRKPSIWRVFWTTVAVAAAGSLLAGLGLFTGAIAKHSDAGRTSPGDYVRLFILDLTFWGPVLVLTVWQITIPVIVALGVLVASLHMRSKTDPRNGD
jgi:hypothetical protein